MKRLVLTFAAITMACGDDAGGGTTDADTANADSTGDDSTSAGVTESGSTGPGDSSGGTSLTADGSSSGGIASDGSETGTSTDGGTDTGSGDTTTGMPAELLVEIGNPEAFMDCMPIVPPDPLNFSFTLDFDNQGGAVTSADVTTARFASGGVEVATFEITPDTFGPFDPGETTSEAASKVGGSLMPQMGCQTLDCGSDYDVEIELDVDGSFAMATATVTVQCAF